METGSIIGIGGEKGGCGKTTLATNIAATLANKGFNVGLLDADKKPASSNWAKSRSENKADLAPITSKRAIGDIDAVIKDMGQKFDFTIVDCGGMDSVEMRYALAFGDVFICPFMPSRYDTDTTAKIESIVEQGKVFNPKLRAYSLISAASNNGRSKMTIYARENLSSLKSLACMLTCTHMLDEYRHTAIDGRGVIEGKNDKAKQEIEAIIEEILNGSGDK